MQLCIDDNRCFLVSLCLEQQWPRVLELLSQGLSANSVSAQFKVILSPPPSFTLSALSNST
jgi:hypothetical protein